MRPMTSPTLLLAASLLLAALPAFATTATTPATPETESAATASTSSPDAVAPAAQGGDALPQVLPLLAPGAEPMVGGGCGAKHTLEYGNFFVTSQSECTTQCTSWCDGLGGRVVSASYSPRSLCDCLCCV